MSSQGSDSFKVGAWADQDVPDTIQDFGCRKQYLLSSGVFRSGDGFVFQPGDGFTGRGWEAGTTDGWCGCFTTDKCVDDVCAVKITVK